MTPSQTIIEEFRLALKMAKISKARAAELIGIHPQTIGRILNGESHTNAETLDAIAELTEKLKKSGLMAI
jgi:transcriptional regulator with XRE-family HTH domain